MKTSSVCVFQGGSAAVFLLKKSGILWVGKGVSGIVFTGEGA